MGFIPGFISSRRTAPGGTTVSSPGRSDVFPDNFCTGAVGAALGVLADGVVTRAGVGCATGGGAAFGFATGAGCGGVGSAGCTFCFVPGWTSSIRLAPCGTTGASSPGRSDLYVGALVAGGCATALGGTGVAGCAGAAGATWGCVFPRVSAGSNGRAEGAESSHREGDPPEDCSAADNAATI